MHWPWQLNTLWLKKKKKSKWTKENQRKKQTSDNRRAALCKKRMNMPRHTSCCHGYGSWSYVHASFTCAAFTLKWPGMFPIWGRVFAPRDRVHFQGKCWYSCFVPSDLLNIKHIETTLTRCQKQLPGGHVPLHCSIFLSLYFFDFMAIGSCKCCIITVSCTVPIILPEMFLNVAACMSSESHLWYLNGYRCILQESKASWTAHRFIGDALILSDMFDIYGS